MYDMTFLKKVLVVFLIGSVALTGMAYTVKEDNKYFEIVKNIEIFTNLYKELNTHYVDEIDPGKLMRTGLEAMVESLDPFTNYIPESRIEDYRFRTEGKYRGIGAQVRQKGEYVIITEPYEDSPAVRAGLQAGDLIIAVDGKSTKGKTPDDVNKILQGFPGSEIELTIQRQGDKKPMDISLVRGEVNVPNVPYSGMVSEDVGYVNLTTFTRNAGGNVQDALRDLRRENPDLKGVILDLRDNGGGLLIEAVNVVNTFVAKGEHVVSMRGKIKERDRDFKTMGAPVDEDISVAVLINSRSASASEIVSGALQDLDRAVLLGQRSYGKGLVQNTMDVGYNSQLKVTTAKYYIPSGRCIQSVEYEDGEPVHIPDEERSKFKTRGGRTVLDGGGVKPDIMMKEVTEYPIIKALEESFMILDFATKYQQAHEEIAPAKTFRFEDFEGFLTFLQEQDFDYDSRAEEHLREFEKQAEQEGLLDRFDAELKTMREKIAAEQEAELRKHKDDILRLIQKEIVSRYYYQRGRVENGLQNDPEVDKAIVVLTEVDQYKKILRKVEKK